MSGKRLGVNWPVATERTSTVLSLMMGLNMCLVSAVPARFLQWHLRIKRSSCFWRRTRMSSRRRVYSSERRQEGDTFIYCQTRAGVNWSHIMYSISCLPIIKLLLISEYKPIVLSLFTFHDSGPSCTIVLLVRSRFWWMRGEENTFLSHFHLAILIFTWQIFLKKVSTP